MKRLIFTVLISLFFISFLCAQDSPLWLRYPAISPDGEYIAFSYKGDIYKVSANGGLAIPLTLSDAHDFMPVWSPDGKYLAFASDRYGNYDVFIIPSDGGTARRLTYYSSNDFPSDFTPDGQNVIFTSSRMHSVTNIQFPTGALPELYSVPVTGGREKQILSTPAIDSKMDKSGTRIIFHDRKGYENPWRKHHTSSIASDIWLYSKTDDKFTKLSDFEGEDRSPVWSANEQNVFYLSEKSGSFNIWKTSISNPSSPSQITSLSKHPVRFLTISKNEIMCFSFNGEIYTVTENSQPQKVNIRIAEDERFIPVKNVVFTSDVTEMNVSPNGKEVAFVIRGEVFVTSLELGTTKRITNTPEQERSVSFSPDGRSLIYASERNQIWGIYQTSIARDEEKYFFNSTLLKEEPVVVTGKESFQPKYSPDGTEVAFLEERTELRVINLKSKEVRTILPGNRNYSYLDGDQWYDWSPDGKYFLINFIEETQWISQIGIIESSGNGSIINLTKSGFDNYYQRWVMNGKMMMWFTTRNGLRNQSFSAAQSDAYGLFFTQEEYDKFKMNKEEFAILKEQEAKEKKKDSDKVEEIKIDTTNLENRKVRLTPNSSQLAGAELSPDGEQLFYFCKYELGYDIWSTKFRDNETKLLFKLGAKEPGELRMDKEGKELFVLADGHMMKIDIAKNEIKPVMFSAEMSLNTSAEREYLFEHIWRQVLKKFYAIDLQKTDWDFYKKEYSRFLPHINNNRDFAEMASEMLGELNASHTGSGYIFIDPNGDQTAALGVYYDDNYTGNGLKIAEVMENSPLIKAEAKIKAGDIIEKIDGNEIKPETDFYEFLNRKAGKYVLLSLYNESSNERWEQTVKPVSIQEQNELLYQRWVKTRAAEVERLSGGKIGYVHVRGMNDASYREVYDEVLGKYINKDALIVDTRFNGGGNLHDELVTFLSGKKYFTFVPRGQVLGYEPTTKWTKPSVVIISESNYSDAHLFPAAYHELGIGKLIGMPIPGTGTAVWWETLIDKTLYFGIPEIGFVTNDGKYLENNQLEPDIKVMNEYGTASKGTDQQLVRAVDELMSELGMK
jgi:Tol biopolymer transport system component/C-terminal processing protease CtpA/Prc